MFPSVLRAITVFLGLGIDAAQVLDQCQTPPRNRTSVQEHIALLRDQLCAVPTDLAKSPKQRPRHARAVVGARVEPGSSPNPLVVFKRACTSGNNYCFGNNVNYCPDCTNCCTSSGKGFCCAIGSSCYGTTCSLPTAWSTRYYTSTTTRWYYVSSSVTYPSTVYATTTIVSTSTITQTSTVPYGAKARLARRTDATSHCSMPARTTPYNAHQTAHAVYGSPSSHVYDGSHNCKVLEKDPSILDPTHISAHLELFSLKVRKIGRLLKRATTSYPPITKYDDRTSWVTTSSTSYIYTTITVPTTSWYYTKNVVTTVTVNKIVTGPAPDPVTTTISTRDVVSVTVVTTKDPPTSNSKIASGTASSSSSTSSVAVVPVNQDDTTTTQKSSLSTTTKIIIGVVAGVAFILAIIGFFLYKWCVKNYHHKHPKDGLAAGAIAGGAAASGAGAGGMSEPKPPAPQTHSPPISPAPYQPVYNPAHSMPQSVDPPGYDIYHDPSAGHGYHEPWTTVSATPPPPAADPRAGSYVPYSVPPVTYGMPPPSNPMNYGEGMSASSYPTPTEIYSPPQATELNGLPRPTELNGLPPPTELYGHPPPTELHGMPPSPPPTSPGSPSNDPPSPIRRKLVPLASLAALPLAALPKFLSSTPNHSKHHRVKRRKNQLAPYHHHHIYPGNKCLTPEVVGQCELLRRGHVCKIPEEEPRGPCVCRDEGCALNKEDHECVVEGAGDEAGVGGEWEGEGCGCADRECAVSREVAERGRTIYGVAMVAKTGVRESVRLVYN